MRDRASAPVLLTAVLVLALASIGAAALSAEEAEKLFQSSGCTGCHNGVVAPDFQGTIAVIREWASKYETLDEAVAAEAPNFKMFNNAKSWDELMSSMPGITPELKDYFARVFEEAKTGAVPVQEQPAGETTEQPVQPTTPVVTQPKPKPAVNVTKLPEVSAPNPSAQAESLVKTGLPAGVAVLITAIVILAAFTKKARQH
ncbi:hypothetical protein [Hyperthermus butylicus]|uniref:Cytochrome c domain-containing protein n=1 Tax=Hyperthermus butylicus (strain DSM 5456 / JCM 9403 / PLM1-5) TaxID=415426 RepID=A2BMK8_HYPBU|nr:hypothetical protein [Hyperthermus butylicus]ABM81219.1 hypothetical protein Hbut_1395 [Hyperthermus butylicus DSM 5456]